MTWDQIVNATKLSIVTIIQELSSVDGNRGFYSDSLEYILNYSFFFLQALLYELHALNL